MVINVVVEFCFDSVQGVCNNRVIVTVFFAHGLDKGCQNAADRCYHSNNYGFHHS